MILLLFCLHFLWPEEPPPFILNLLHYNTAGNFVCSVSTIHWLFIHCHGNQVVIRFQIKVQTDLFLDSQNALYNVIRMMHKNGISTIISTQVSSMHFQYC